MSEHNLRSKAEKYLLSTVLSSDFNYDSVLWHVYTQLWSAPM